MVELVRARAEIHHEPDHLVAAESLQYLAHRAFWREDVHILVGSVRDEKIHQPLVLELVGDDVERHLVGDPRSTDLEVAEVHRDEDASSAVVACGTDMGPRARVDGDQPLEVRDVQTREPHDLDEILREIPERPPRHAGNVAVIHGFIKDDREVLLGDSPPAHPDQVRDLSAEHRGGIGHPRRQALRERRAQAPSPEGRAVEQTVAHYDFPVSVWTLVPLM